MPSPTVVLVRQAGLGVVEPQDQTFSVEMLDKFLHTLEALNERPSAICFYTAGVRLVCDGSPVLAGLQLLQDLGVRLVSCGSCLDYFGLRDTVRVGEVGTMQGIVGLLMSAASVITV
jgi:hypothetical protein